MGGNFLNIDKVKKKKNREYGTNNCSRQIIKKNT